MRERPVAVVQEPCGVDVGNAKWRQTSPGRLVAVVVMTCLMLPGWFDAPRSERRAGAALAATSGHILTVELYLASSTASSGDRSRCGPGKAIGHSDPEVLPVAIVAARGTVVRGLLRRESEEGGQCAFEGSFFVSDAARYSVFISEVGSLASSKDQLERNAWRMTLGMGSP